MGWESIKYVSSGITLVAFIVAALLTAYRRKLRSREKQIELAPAEDRAQLVTAALEFFPVDTTGLSEKRKYGLALEQIRQRARRFLIIAVVFGLVFAISAIVAVVAILQPVKAERQVYVPNPADFLPRTQPTAKHGTWSASFEPEELNHPTHWRAVFGRLAANRDPKKLEERGLTLDGPGLFVSVGDLGKKKFFDFRFTIVFEFLKEGDAEFWWALRLNPDKGGYFFRVKRQRNVPAATTETSLQVWPCATVRANADCFNKPALAETSERYSIASNSCADTDNASFQVDGVVDGRSFSLQPALTHFPPDQTNPCRKIEPPVIPRTYQTSGEFPSGLFGLFATSSSSVARVKLVRLESLADGSI